VNLGSPFVCHTGGTWILTQDLVKLLTWLGVYETSGTGSSCLEDVNPSHLAKVFDTALEAQTPTTLTSELKLSVQMQAPAPPMSRRCTKPCPSQRCVSSPEARCKVCFGMIQCASLDCRPKPWTTSPTVPSKMPYTIKAETLPTAYRSLP